MSEARPRRLAIGIDVGGTFTDAVAVDAATGRLVDAFKLPTTADPSVAVLQAIDRLRANESPPSRAEGGSFTVLHGTTIGTNALIQKRGARTALVATAGFRDVIALRRQARPRLFALRQSISEPLVPRERRFEIDERVAFDGEVIRPLERAALGELVERLRCAEIEAVAVCLLHAYANDAHERAVAEALREALPHCFVSVSSEICPEFREFERSSTTVVNAYIGPPVAGYLRQLDGALAARGADRLLVVKSNGGLASARTASAYPAHLIESGPAAGVVAAAGIARLLGIPNLIAYDMGGTTAKVGVVAGGEPRVTTEFYADRFVEGQDLGGYPIKSPVIDLIEIGAGGGSIARLERGVVKVGPESAGADPGPACYGRGGELPTVTDAHAVLGTLTGGGLAASHVDLDLEAARAAIERGIARPLGWEPHRAAYAILDVANANMAEAVRLATVRRGLDPRDFALLAYGGGGPLHAAAIARDVGIARVLVPPYPGLFSAAGALMAPLRHDLVRTLLRGVSAELGAELERVFAQLRERAAALIASDGGDLAATSFRRQADARFRGQLFEVTLELGPDGETLPEPESIELQFRARYRELYGYDLPAAEVEIVNLRLVAVAPAVRMPALSAGEEARPAPRRTGFVLDRAGRPVEVPLLRRSELRLGAAQAGPLLVQDHGSTVQVLEGQAMRLLDSGILEIVEGERRCA